MIDEWETFTAPDGEPAIRQKLSREMRGTARQGRPWPPNADQYLAYVPNAALDEWSFRVEKLEGAVAALRAMVAYAIEPRPTGWPAPMCRICYMAGRTDGSGVIDHRHEERVEIEGKVDFPEFICPVPAAQEALRRLDR